MATFNNCRASNNEVGGFVTTSLFSKFDNCVAEGNNGPGFLDLSGEPVDKLLSMFPVLHERAQMFQPGVRKDEVVDLLATIEKAIRDKKDDKSFLDKAFAKLRELTIDWSSEAAAQLIFLFATKSDEIITLLQHNGILKH